MTRGLRLVFVLAILCPALLATGCSSNNTGKIVGKWKMVSGKGMEAQKATMDSLKAYVFMEFKPDNTVSIGVESSDPAFQKILAAGAEKTNMTGKYKLKSGNTVEMYDMPKQNGTGFFQGKDRAQTDIKIEGTKMTMTDPDGSTFQLEKV